MPFDLEALPRELVPLTEGERRRLIPSLSTRIQLEELERQSIHSARVWAMRRAASRDGNTLDEDFARELHRRMFGGIWRGAGRYRTVHEDHGWEPQRISEGVRMVLDDAEGWIRFSTYPLHEVAVRMHHRLGCVRPWSDGNGNHARLMADILVQSSGEEPLTWGSRALKADPLQARIRYANATAAADAGDMAPMLEFARG
jgi:Fic-DOC domain mobile mystery protein B